MTRVDEITRETTRFYDEYADEYEKNTEGLGSGERMKTFLSLLPDKSEILDAGCAFGRDTERLSKHVAHISGIDLSEAMLEKARARVPAATFENMDVRAMRFDRETFNGIWCSALFVHIPKADAERALSELWRILRPGGILYLSLKEGEKEGWTTDDRYGGIRKYFVQYSRAEVERLLPSVGFDIVAVEERRWKNHPYRTPQLYVFARKADD